jgi:hypothetical protein
MFGSENTGAATGSGSVDMHLVEITAVDTEFWALILQDEEWLAAEFTAIVSEPGETRLRTSGRPSTIDAAPAEGSATPAATAGARQGWRTGWLPGRRWRRERSPPANV